jgi:hypothetical protein
MLYFEVYKIGLGMITMRKSQLIEQKHHYENG